MSLTSQSIRTNSNIPTYFHVQPDDDIFSWPK